MKSQEEFYLEAIRVIIGFLEKGIEIDSCEMKTFVESVPQESRMETKPTGWKELRIVFKPKKEEE